MRWGKQSPLPISLYGRVSSSGPAILLCICRQIPNQALSSRDLMAGGSVSCSGNQRLKRRDQRMVSAALCAVIFTNPFDQHIYVMLKISYPGYIELRIVLNMPKGLAVKARTIDPSDKRSK